LDERRLYAREASPSMFAYCTEVLHLSEAEAYLRIAAARASREHPILLMMLADGRLHLTGIAKLAPHLTAENAEALLERTIHRSKRQIEELVAELAPRPDVPAMMRRLPDSRPGAESAPVALLLEQITVPGLALPPKSVATDRQLGPDGVGKHEPELRPDGVETREEEPRPDGVSRSSPARSPARSDEVQPLSPGRYRVQFTASAELYRKLERLRALTRSSGGDLAAIIEQAVTEKLERLEARRFARAKTARRGPSDTDTAASSPHAAPSSRHVPAAVRRAVVERDGNRCRYMDGQGRRCTERNRLEFHHRHPYGLGGDHGLENIRLMCRLCRYRHNRHYAGSRIIPRRRGTLGDVRGSWGRELPLVGIIPPVPRFTFRSVDREEEAWMRYGSGSLDH
jgi:5-methylcytosine-specific restriction endonuclease McrA